MNRFKYLFLAVLILLLINITSYAQDDNSMFTVKNLRITLREKEIVKVNGNVEVLTNSDQNQNIHNAGIFIITDTLKNSVDSLFLTSSVPGLP